MLNVEECRTFDAAADKAKLPKIKQLAVLDAEAACGNALKFDDQTSLAYKVAYDWRPRY